MAKGKQIPYTPAELAWIEQNRTLPRKEAQELFCKQFQRDDVTFDAYKALCTRKGWTTGRTGQIEKGTAAWNKGKVWEEGEGAKHPNARRTQFKKGNAPHNMNYLGHERVSKDGYVEISIPEVNPHTGYERRYELKHKVLWEQANGKVPEGMCLKCLDSNRQNTDPSNWTPVPRGTLPFLNGHRGHNYDLMPEELKPAVLALAKVKHAKSVAAKRRKERQ